MAKYDPLQEYLERRGTTGIQLGFEDIERIIGTALPDSAARSQWWANETDPATAHVQCRSWRNAGYNAFLLSGQRVLFEKHPA